MLRVHGWRNAILRAAGIAMTFAMLAGGAFAADPAPAPLLAKGKPVDWWFVFKFNSTKTFAGCVPAKEAQKQQQEEQRQCIFGGKVQTKSGFGQQFAFASKDSPELAQGHGCTGATLTDPVGATFDQVYNGAPNYLI